MRYSVGDLSENLDQLNLKWYISWQRIAATLLHEMNLGLSGHSAGVALQEHSHCRFMENKTKRGLVFISTTTVTEPPEERQRDFSTPRTVHDTILSVGQKTIHLAKKGHAPVARQFVNVFTKLYIRILQNTVEFSEWLLNILIQRNNLRNIIKPL